MKSERLILSVGIISCVLFLQGWFAAQTLGEDKAKKIFELAGALSGSFGKETS